jgi:hypothetical protein
MKNYGGHDTIMYSLRASELSSAAGSSAERPKMETPAGVRVRQIEESDTDNVVALLSLGFSDRTPDYWRNAMARLKARHLPGDYPRYGYALTDKGVVTGVLLLIFSRTDTGDIRANVSSWYVEPKYRLFSNMLLAQALRLPDVTFVNVSPAPHTLQTIGQQGFVPYVGGTFVAVAALGTPRRGAKIGQVAPYEGEDASIVQRQAALGCLSYEVTFEGQTYPFAFLPRTDRSTGIRFAQLVYCRDIADFARLGGPLGRHLLRQGYLFVILDANGPIKGLLGHYLAGRKVKCSRGPAQPRLGDLTETELVLFGP